MSRVAPNIRKSLLIMPPLKWAGGKRWLVPTLLEHWQRLKPTRLVEPFCGGLSVALGLQLSQAFLNDANPHLINFYRQLQKGLVITEVFKNERAYYNQARDRFNELIQSGQTETPEAAQWFYYLNRTGFNGLCRFNSKGLYNVPFGRYKTINYLYDFTPYKETLAGWQFTLGDFEQLHCQPEDLLYADPPYDVEFTTYSQGGFSWSDQERLAEWLAKQPCPIIVSNQATPRILKLYQEYGFRIETLKAPRRIACNGDRTPAMEMLAFKGF